MIKLINFVPFMLSSSYAQSKTQFSVLMENLPVLFGFQVFCISDDTGIQELQVSSVSDWQTFWSVEYDYEDQGSNIQECEEFKRKIYW